MREWEASIGVPQYTKASSLLIHHVIALSAFFAFFLISGLIFIQLFGGLFELCFLQILYAQKALDV